MRGLMRSRLGSFGLLPTVDPDAHCETRQLEIRSHGRLLPVAHGALGGMLAAWERLAVGHGSLPCSLRTSRIDICPKQLCT